MGLVSQFRLLYEKIYRTVLILLQHFIKAKGRDHISRYMIKSILYLDQATSLSVSKLSPKKSQLSAFSPEIFHSLVPIPLFPPSPQS